MSLAAGSLSSALFSFPACRTATAVLFLHNATHFPRNRKSALKGGGGGGGDDKADDDFIDSLVAMAGPLAGQLSLGTAMGLCSGYALKVIGKAGAFTVGVFFIVIQGLSYCGYIEVKWAKVIGDAEKKLDTDGDGKVGLNDIKNYAKWTLHCLKVRQITV
jgi:uncharacterized membrane protein (Fun14 family)